MGGWVASSEGREEIALYTSGPVESFVVLRLLSGFREEGMSFSTEVGSD